MMKRKIVSMACILFMLILAVIGIVLYQDQQYNTISMIIVCLSCLPFFFKYEHRKPQTREIVVLAIMVALTVVSRAIFMITPNFKPMTVLVILCGMVFQKESGFLCGSLGALLSNFLFGQGPWTPFQMISWGLIGYGAGVINKRQYLEKNTLALYVYAMASGIFFSMLMDVWAVMSLDTTFNLQRYLASLVTSLPMMITYVISNVIFMVLLKDRMLQIFSRVKIKYGMLEENK